MTTKIRSKHERKGAQWHWVAWCDRCNMELARWREPVNTDTADLWTSQLQNEHEQACCWRDPDWAPPLEKRQVAAWDGEEWHIIGWEGDTEELDAVGLVVRR